MYEMYINYRLLQIRREITKEFFLYPTILNQSISEKYGMFAANYYTKVYVRAAK